MPNPTRARPGHGGRFACAVAAAILLAGAMGGCKQRGLGFGEGNDASFAALDDRGRAGRPLSVVFFGGSLTWGTGASDPQRTSYRALTSAYLRRRYPKSPIAFHDAAVGGTGSKLGLFRLDRDVLAHRPDLVFLEFAAADDLSGTDTPTLAAHETLLREMIRRGVPVIQVLLGFRRNFQPRFQPRTVPRYQAHLRLARAYRTGTADSFPYVQQRLDDRLTTPDRIWPIDGAGPGDEGYELFYEAVRNGFDRAVRERRTCLLPDEPVFGLYRTRRRRLLAQQPMPIGWGRRKPYRTSLRFDGLSSRWMGDVTVCNASDGTVVQPWRLRFEGTLLGVFGEADENGLGFRVFVDGKLIRYAPPQEPASAVWPADTKRFGTGKLLFWRVISTTLPPGPHKVEIRPVIAPDAPAGQLRIESLCTAGP